jgi:hypothetical protein
MNELKWILPASMSRYVVHESIYSRKHLKSSLPDIKSRDLELEPEFNQLVGSHFRRCTYFQKLTLMGAKQFLQTLGVPLKWDKKMHLLFSTGTGNFVDLERYAKCIFSESYGIASPMAFASSVGNSVFGNLGKVLGIDSDTFLDAIALGDAEFGLKCAVEAAEDILSQNLSAQVLIGYTNAIQNSTVLLDGSTEKEVILEEGSRWILLQN